jgi:transposase
MKESQVAMKTLNIDHLGIVAGIIDEMELVEEVNKMVGIKTKEILTSGEFFVGKATEHLIGEGVLPEHLNDDKLGRELDKYHQIGTTKIFTTVAMKAAHKFQVETDIIHLDGTSMSVEGEYKKEIEEIEKTKQETAEDKLEREPEMKAIEIVHGYSRDKRPDLKQFIMDMIVTGDGDIPLYLKVDSGNVDDKSVFVERLKEFKKQWTFEGICVADSALYTAENLAAMRELKWITRVPLSIKEAKNKIVDIKESEWKDSQISGYKIAAKESEYAGIKQRWIIVESEIRKKSSIQQVEKQVKKQESKAKAALSKLSRQEFACQADAKIAIEKLSKSWKYHQIKEIEYIEKPEYKTVGRPSKLTEPSQIKYQVKGQIETKEEVTEAEKIKAGRFILATNVLDKNELSDEQVLEEYKAQQSNERGFRFLKDPLFFTSSVFVKTPERVEAIAMIMGLCLLVYNLAQRKLRQELAKFDDGIRNQVKKITNKPTMRWVFQMFQAVHLVIINGQKQMSNLTEEREKIVRYLGKSCSKYYLIM